MQEITQPAAIAKDVPAILGKLKDLINANRDPWDKDVEYLRQKLRRVYLQLLLSFSYSPQAKKADTRMWLETSHAFITHYKEKLAALDKLINAPPDPRTPSRLRHGPVEYRKLAQRFRQFLAEEEKFWAAFVVRFVRLFALDEAKGSLTTLGIALGDLEPEHSSAGAPPKSRFHLFPEESEPIYPSPSQRPERLVILSKALVCIGDIARYREQYNESGGRPKAGQETHDNAPRRGGRGGRREPAPRPRNYSRAHDCYEQARLLFPDSGNSSHQLAILASYQADTFNSIYHYYRALCVSNPYTAALENMEKQMSRYVDSHLAAHLQMRAQLESDDQPPVPRVRVDNFKEAVVLLHALWRSDASESQDMAGHSDWVTADLESMVAERILPPDIITKSVVLATGALWTHRMFRGSRPRESILRAPLETLILIHILDIFRALIQVSIRQLTDIANVPEDKSLDFAQYITAVLRRMLPGLRICTKWLKQNVDYVVGPHAPQRPEFADAVAKMWDAYTDFASLLLRVFPMDHLRPMRAPLEEDMDMTGFSPLKQSMFQPSSESVNGARLGQNEVHPNEEQLMRIHDLIRDAKAIAADDHAPIYFSQSASVTKFVVRTPELVLDVPSSPLEFIPPSVSDLALYRSSKTDVIRTGEEDDSATVSTRTEDDPVNMAMRAVLSPTDDDDDDEEQILYPKSVMTPRYSRALMRAHRIEHLHRRSDRPRLPSSPNSSFGPASAHNRNPSTTTAMDLVNQMLAARRPSDASQNVTTPQPPLLFGANADALPTSIWSKSLDEVSPSAMNLSPYGPFSPSSPPSWSSPAAATSSPTKPVPRTSPTSLQYPSIAPLASIPMHQPQHPFAAAYSNPIPPPVVRPRNYYDTPPFVDQQPHAPIVYPVHSPYSAAMHARPFS